MAKINVMGNAVVFQSAMKLEDLEQVKKYRPEALCVKGGEDGKEILFVCTTAPGTMGDVDDKCVIFGQASHDEEKLATITKVVANMPDSQEEIKSLLADKLGAALNYMNKLEASLPAVLEEVKKEREAVLEAIEVA